ncbi:uncharacterized protein LOC122574072 [Bombus pyrosoma]|uniref:uncharacterized protein LOC122574072 n=1 Tax=Bombus pyrosoma TaxID=396416 RepID=UPI001CB8BD12|nr:uncharacterized protein LOC122574072 [Bombus pyrosoma]
MGNSNQKMKRKLRGKGNRKRGSNDNFQSSGNSTTKSDEYNDPELIILRKSIERNPEMFVLNNLMMCVQFFGNYEEEIKRVKETMASSREMQMNKRLPPQKHVLLPDILQEHIARHLGFTSMRQSYIPTIEPLQPVRIYMVHDNIDIIEEGYSSHYSNVNDTTVYNILLKPTNQQGFVQLQVLDNFIESRKATREDDVDLTSIAENDDELYSDGSIYSPKSRSNLSVHSVSSSKSKLEMVKNSNFKHTRSLPNLCDEEVGNGSFLHSNRSRKIAEEPDYDNGSSDAEERKRSNKRPQTKEELPNRGSRRWEKQVPRQKIQGPNSQDPTSSNSSGYRSDNYAYSSDSSCNPSRNSKFSQSSSYDELDECWITNGEFPRRCFKKITYMADGNLYDPKTEKLQKLDHKQRRIKMALSRYNYNLFYISSTEFMKHFMKMFLHRLGESLNFDQESVDDTKREGCVLYCDKIMIGETLKHSKVEQYEIIPAIWLEWPICAQEWLVRTRHTWPNNSDVGKVKDFGCYVVPEGFVPRDRNSNLIEDLQWQLTFPAAERYLETCMTQAQIQVYLIALMLHKTFLRPIFDTMFGLTTAHIRHKLFWMIEENANPSKWPDSRLGECLLMLLNSLYYNISQNEPKLNDYFIKSRNLFQRIPCEHLLHTQKQLKRITENPIMYVFHAMENIRYSNDFFPRLDYEMLLKILTADTLTLVNPKLTQHVPVSMYQTYEDPTEQNTYDMKSFWETARKQGHKPSINLVTNKSLIVPRKATDSIIEIATRCADLEGPRLCILLGFFIRHFIQIAERCNQYQAHRQKKMYLDHADRLSILLFERQRYTEDAIAYRDKIKDVRKKVAVSEPGNQPPDTPERNPKKPIYVGSLNNRFTQESNSSNQVRQKTIEPIPRLSVKLPQKQVNVQDVKVIVHERHYEEPNELNLEVTIDKVAAQSSISENHVSKLETDEPNKPILRIQKLSGSESTYI